MDEHFGFPSEDVNEENGTRKSPGQRHFKPKSWKDQKEKVALRKEIRKKKQDRKKRIIIRNLSFKVNEEDLKAAFSEYGDVVDVSIPKTPDGKLRGFAFIQYKKFQNAIAAVRNLNYKKLKGRPIAVDYAVAKDKYQHITSSKHTENDPDSRSKEKNDNEMMEESENEVENEVSAEENKSDLEGESADESVSDEGDDHVKKFLKEFDADQESVKDNEDKSEESQSASDSSSESDDDSVHSKADTDESDDGDDDDDNLSSDDAEITSSKRKKSTHDNNEGPLQKKKNLSHDVNEGKTVFIRNVSFDSSEDSLKTAMEAFGPVSYCLLCIDQFTELPRGTAFVKFENKEDADKVIEKSSDTDTEGIYLDGRRLSCTCALSREELQTRRESDNTKTGKDKRNIYLLKEGLIRLGSAEAAGVSQSDLATRSKMEILKRNKLKNLQFFVSDKRLCIHNIPSYYTDSKLREIFKNAAGYGAKITEAKIMRDMNKVNPQNVAKSKGFGFVAFQKHEDALKALREINNNPDIFTPQKRPIVEFAVENMNALIAKQRRQERSQMKIKKQSENSEANDPQEENLMSLKFNKKGNDNKRNGKADGWNKRWVQNDLDSSQHKKNKSKKKKKLENKLNEPVNSYFKQADKYNNDSAGSPTKEKPQKKKKLENKFSRPMKYRFKQEHKYNNNRTGSPTKEKPQKKKKNKQQRKNKLSSQSIDNNQFTQMVSKYKQQLLSKM